MSERERGETITLYTSHFCGHARMVERFLADHQIPAEVINIDGDPEAREELMQLNNGYASTPTLLFPDGTQLTEPPLGLLRKELGLITPGFMDQLRGLFGTAKE